MIRFHCSKCAMKLMVEPEYAGSNVTCPSCGLNLTVPAASAGSEAGAARAGREGWKETDPTNPNLWIALGIGVGIFVLIYLLALPFKYTKSLLYERGWVQFAETFFFGWGVAFLVLKLLKIRHQQSALRLDVLPVDIAREIAKDNVSSFIQHVYSLPVKLRDSLMVNRIRKALELFETRQVNAEVSTMMSNQSNIDGSRIGGSYTLVKVFIWAIPILGFIGTVIGLSQAIGYFQGVMSPEAIKDSSIMMKSMGGVTGGLATAFDTTLLGLLYALFLTLPMSSLQKLEEDTLTNVDAYCNENFLPRLNDGSNTAGGDMGALADVLSASITRAHTQFLTGLDAASKMVREQAEGLDKRATENQKLVQENFTKAIAAFNETAGKTLTDLGKSAGTSIETLSTTLKKATEHVGALEKVASTQQAQLDASVKETLAKLQQDSSKVIAEAMKSSIGETSKAIENTFKPAVEQVNALTEAVKATAQHVGTLQKQASEHQSSVQKAMQEAVANVQKDAGKVLEESIKASAAQSSKAIEESIKPAMLHLAAIGETAKSAVAEATSLQKQSREQHAAGQQSFIETTAKLQQSLAKALEDAIRPAAQQLGSLGDSVKTAAGHVASLERNAAEQQAAMQRAMQESIARVQEDASRSLADSIRNTANQSSKAMEEVMRPAVAQLAAIGETAKNAVTEATSMQKQAREQQAAGQASFIETTAKLQRDLAKSLEDTVRPAVQQLSSLGDAVKGTASHVAGLEKQARDQQIAAERAMHEATSQMQREAARALEEALRPAGQHLATLGEAVKNVISQMSQLDRSSREQQSAAQKDSLEVTRQMQRDATKSLEDNLRPVAQQLSALSESIRAVTGQLGGLDRAAADAQATVARSVESSMSRVQQDVSRASSEAMQTANTQLATLQQGIAALNETLVALGGKTIVIQQATPAKGGLLGRFMGK
ncbi:MAG: MotA/TolQ/ExbB proton channel family protein [Limisphaerales bacterium]